MSKADGPLARPYKLGAVKAERARLGQKLTVSAAAMRGSVQSLNYWAGDFEIRTCVSALDLLDVHLHGDSFHRQIGAATNNLKGECTGNRSTIMSWTSSHDVQRILVLRALQLILAPQRKGVIMSGCADSGIPAHGC